MENKNQETLLRVDHLCQYFGATKAVDDVSFEIKKGEVFGLVGESGCGKTTTGRSIIKLYNITSGSVFFKGIRIAAGKKSYKDAIEKAKQDYKTASKEHPENAAALKAEMDKTVAEQRSLMKQADADQKHCDKAYARQRAAEVREKFEALIAKASGEEKTKLEAEYKNELRKAKKTKLVTQIQMIFQDPMTSLNPTIPVGDQIGEVLHLHRRDISRAELAAGVDKILEMVGIPAGRKGDYPHQFSGGMKQRIVIAIALACEPKLLLADEPTTALDVTIQAQVLDMMSELKEKLNTSMVLITHDLGVVAQTCDKVAIMYAGEIIEFGTAEDIFNGEKRHPYTEGLFGSIPDLTKRTRRLSPIEGLMPDPTDLPKGCKFHDRCPNCMEICRTTVPPEVQTESHLIRCHLMAEASEGGAIR